MSKLKDFPPYEHGETLVPGVPAEEIVDLLNHLAAARKIMGRHPHKLNPAVVLVDDLAEHLGKLNPDIGDPVFASAEQVHTWNLERASREKENHLTVILDSMSSPNS